MREHNSWSPIIMRTLYLVLQILLAPLVIMNLYICVGTAMSIAGVNQESFILIDLLAVAVGIGAWGMNAGLARVLAGDAPIWMRLLSVPGALFSVVACFATYANPGESITLDMLWRWEPWAKHLGGDHLAIFLAFSVLTSISPVAVVWLERKRKPQRDRMDI
jgi:hypothetical protein